MENKTVLLLLCVLFCHAIKSHGFSLPADDSSSLLENVLRQYDAKFSLSSIWEQIKYSILNIWNTVIDSVNETIDKITLWISELNSNVDELFEKTKEKLYELKEKLNEKLAELAEKSEEMAGIIKQCYDPQHDHVESIVLESLNGIRKCLFETKRISDLEHSKMFNVIDNDKIIEHLKDKLDLCAKDYKNMDGCLIEVKHEISQMDKNITRHEIETRSIIDTVVDKLVLCSTDGLRSAAEKLSEIVMIIGQCVNDKIKEKNDFNLHMTYKSWILQ